MRNLKKILALVLALVMSLSLMATAGAADFTDKADIKEDYQSAVDVLNGLEVFRGYENGSFQPKGDITRAEVATIIYRIATADVHDTQAGIYTTWGKFADVKDTAWYAGYVNYCANAQIVKGETATIFNPEARITGYQVLAMILRTMGYGKNGEFEGPNWAINTAAQAKQLGIIDGVTENLLGANATREFVAQILFKAILISKVDYNALEGYKPNGTTLAKEKFGMEKVTGVVMANEYADLESTSTLGGGKTRLKVGDKDYTLNVTTDLTDIGESRTVYVQKTTKNSFNLVVDKMYGSESNVRAESGDKTSVSALAATENLSVGGAQYFVNFDYATVGKSEYRIEYSVSFDNSKVYDGKTAQQWFEAEYGVDPADVIATDATNRLDEKSENPLTKVNTYTRVIPMGNEITTKDVTIMRGIFSAADDDNHVEVGVTGYVYAGTAKQQNSTDKERDLSSQMTWRDFYEEYILHEVNTKFSSTGNGEWLKVIDNNGDGIAEYVFKTVYVLAETTGYNTRNDYYTYSNENADSRIDLSPDGDAVNYVGDYEPAVGDVVLAALIDGKWQIELAPMETKTIKTVSYKDKTVTTTDGDVWDESVIVNWTVYLNDMLAMLNTPVYEIFFDHFGHVIAYREVSGQVSYALLSELYYTNQYNGKYIKNNTPIVEITVGNEKTVELTVSNSKNNVFDGAGRTYFNGKGVAFTDYLTRAINHLGVTNAAGAPLLNTAAWNAAGTTLNENGQFVYEYNAALYPNSHKVTETNVAAYVMGEDGESVAINSASALKLNRRGEALYYTNLDKNSIIVDGSKNEKVTWDEYLARFNNATAANQALARVQNVFAVDYVKLDATKDVKKGAVRYDIDTRDASSYVYGLVPAADRATWDGNYVNATHNTEYYIVGVDEKTGNTTATVIDGISYFTDYKNVPAIDADDITAIYAVARNTNADVGKRDYWVADVIVIETKDIVQAYDSVSLIYNNPSKTTSQVRELNALDSETVDPSVNLTPKDRTSWPGQWTTADYGFYEVYDETVNEPEIEAGSIEEIPTKVAPDTDYNAHGIYAATVTRDVRVQAEGDYVMIHDGDKTRPTTTNTKEYKLATGEVPVYAVWSVDSTKAYPTWELVDGLTMKSIAAGDEIIYVRDKAGDVKYIVITNYNTHIDSYDWDDGWRQAGWLAAEWTAIINEQNPAAPAPVPTYDVSFNLSMVAGDVAEITPVGGETQTVAYDPALVVGGYMPVTLEVRDPNAFVFTLKMTSGTFAGLVAAAGWTADVYANADGSYTVSMSHSGVALSAAAEVANVGTAYTVAGLTAVVAKTSAETDAKKAQKLADDLIAVLTNLTVEAKAMQAAIINAIADAVITVNPNSGLVKAQVVAAITAALNNGKDINAAIDALIEKTEGDAAKAAAEKEIKEYRADEIADLADPDAKEAAKLQEDALKDPVKNVDGYKKSIDNLLKAAVVEFTTAEGTKKTSDLVEAFAKVEKRGTITLTGNVEIEERIDILSKEVTLDIGKWTIEVTKKIYVKGEPAGMINLMGTANLTIVGTKGAILGHADDTYVLTLIDDAQCTIDVGESLLAGTTSIAETNNNAKLYIESGKFDLVKEFGDWGYKFLLNKNDKAIESSTISVTGGVFVGFNPGAHNADTTTETSSYLATGYKAVEDPEGVFTVVYGK